MPGLHPSCRLEPAVPRPRLYAGADQPARLSLEIGAIKHHGRLLPVVSQEILQMPFCALTSFAPPNGMHLPKVLVVAPLSGHFPILLRDLVIGLLPAFQVFITDWVNARHVALEQGPFDLANERLLRHRDDGATGQRAQRDSPLPRRPTSSPCYSVPRREEPGVRAAHSRARGSSCRPCGESHARRSPDHGAIPFVVRAQRHCSGAAPMSGKRPSRLPWFCPAIGPAELPSPPPVSRRRAPQKDAPRRWRGSPAIPVPRSLFDADGPSGRTLPRHRSPHLPRTLGLEVRAIGARSASGLHRGPVDGSHDRGRRGRRRCGTGPDAAGTRLVSIGAYRKPLPACRASLRTFLSFSWRRLAHPRSAGGAGLHGPIWAHWKWR